MKRIGCMCVALSALFVLDSHGAGIADWSDSARRCLENYATAKVTASTKDVEDTQGRWDKSEAENADVRLSEDLLLFKDDEGNVHKLPISVKANGKWKWGDGVSANWLINEHGGTTENSWLNARLTVQQNGSVIKELNFDIMGSTIVVNKMNLGDLSMSAKSSNIFFLDNDATCRSAILAAENSAVCVSNNIGKIGHFQLFTHNGVVYDKTGEVLDNDLVNQFGKFIAKHNDWLDNLKNNQEILVSVNAKHVNAEGVDVRFVDNSNIEELTANEKHVLFEKPADDKEKQVTILENIRRYFNPAEQRSVVIQSGVQQGTHSLTDEDPNLLVLHNILKPYAKDSDEASKAPNLLSVVKKENGDYAFASYNLNDAVEIRKDGQYLVADSSIENRKTKVLREKDSFDARTLLKTILKAKNPSIVFFGDSKRDLVVAYRKVDNDYVFFLKDDRDAKNYTFSWAVDDVLSHQLKQLQDKQAPFSFADYARADEWDGDENDKKGTVPTQPVAKTTGQGDDKSDLSYEEKQKLYGGTKQQNKS